MSLVGIEYLWQSTLNPDFEKSLVAVNLETMNGASFDAFVNEVLSAVSSEKQAIEAENERKKQEDAKRAEEQKKLDEERAEFERQKQAMQAEKDKLENEVRQIKENRAKQRYEVLFALGLVSVSFNPYLVFTSKHRHITDNQVIHTDEVRDLDDNAYNERLAAIKELIAKYVASDEQSESAKQEQIIAKAKADALYEAAQKEAQKERDAQKAKEAEEAAAKKRADDMLAAAAAEAERISGLSDKQRLAEYIEKLLAVEQPKMATKKWANTRDALIKSINTFLNF